MHIESMSDSELVMQNFSNIIKLFLALKLNKTSPSAIHVLHTKIYGLYKTNNHIIHINPFNP
jgi:hypothetical protein